MVFIEYQSWLTVTPVLFNLDVYPGGQQSGTQVQSPAWRPAGFSIAAEAGVIEGGFERAGGFRDVEAIAATSAK